MQAASTTIVDCHVCCRLGKSTLRQLRRAPRPPNADHAAEAAAAVDVAARLALGLARERRAHRAAAAARRACFSATCCGPWRLPRLPVRRVMPAPAAVLLELDPVGRVSLGLIRLIVAPLAVLARKRYQDADTGLRHRKVSSIHGAATGADQAGYTERAQPKPRPPMTRRPSTAPGWPGSGARGGAVRRAAPALQGAPRPRRPLAARPAYRCTGWSNGPAPSPCSWPRRPARASPTWTGSSTSTCASATPAP